MHRPENPPRITELLRALAGWAIAGAIAGSLVGALAVRANGSLQGEDQALPFVMLTAAAYQVVFLPIGFVVALVARFGGKVRASFSESVIAALIGFGAFAFGQFAIGKVNWRGETNTLNIVCSLVFGVIVAIVARIAIGRTRAFADRRWVVAPVL